MFSRWRRRTPDQAPINNMEAPPQVTSQPMSLPEVIESLGTGLAQVRVGLLAGPVWFADGAELILISSVTEAVSGEWNFSAAERGLVVTVVYLGVLVGNILSGPFGDMMGRRLPILVSFTCVFIFSMLSTLAWGFFSLCFIRFLVGASIGVGQPAQQALVSETTPSQFRICFSSLGQFLFAFGEIYSGFLLLADDPQMQDLHWRTLLIAGAMPSVIFGLLSFAFLNQSPLFLAYEGQYEETQVVLQSMRQDNSASDVCIDFKPHRVICGSSHVQSHFRRMLAIVFGSEHLVLTLILMTSCFVLNLCYYGSLYAFPSVLSKGVEVGSSPAAALIYGAIIEMAGYVVGVICILFIPRLMVMKVYLVSMATALAAFAWGSPVHGGGFFFHFLTMYGYYSSKFSVAIGFLIFYLYASEVFPTAARTTGTAVVFAGGRIAAMLSSVVYEIFLSVFGRFDVFFWMMAVFCAINFWCVSFLTIETFGVVIQDDEDAPENTEKRGYGSTCTH
mmetsp:Transcript_79627/g.234188  ORF Transcript_79627/g.234188 Transcript_79627/m.234188 type:complete len:504 (-) Transcript_79627:44-1555(-)